MTIETNNRQEAITDKILKKAEISRITLQLKKNLLRAGVKAQGNSPIKDDQARRKRSSSATNNDNSSPLKRQSVHPPSSPIYDSTIQPPKTPPLEAAKLPTPLLSTPKSHGVREFKTPNTRKMPSRLSNGDVDEGADLLMFLATSPSPATHKERDYKMPLTPKHISNHLSVPTGSTPPSSNSHTIRMNTPGRLHPKTPNFSMSDYVNFFTPSPRYNKPPDTGYLGGRTLNFDKGKD